MNTDSVNDTLAASINPMEKQTIGEHLDERITNLRKQLEAVCITKAKAEAMQCLNFPMKFIHDISWI